MKNKTKGKLILYSTWGTVISLFLLVGWFSEDHVLLWATLIVTTMGTMVGIVWYLTEYAIMLMERKN